MFASHSSSKSGSFNTLSSTCSTWSRSEMKITEVIHKWTIENVRYQNLDSLKSATFSSPGLDRSRFCLFMTDFGTVDVRLCMIDSDEPEILLKWKLSVLDGWGNVKFSKFSDQDRLKPSKDFSNTSIINLGLTEGGLFEGKDSMIDFNGSLTLECSVGIIQFGSTQTTSGSSMQTLKDANAKESRKKILKDLATFYSNLKHTDVVLVVGAKEIPAHKCILAARSPVFCAMFEHETKENQENKVVITDVEVAVFEVMLKYIYTGVCEEMEKYAIELMIAADVYQLDQLKSHCEQVLSAKLTAKLAPKLLVLADTYNALKLKKKVVSCIQKTCADVIYLLCKEKNADKLLEIFKTLISQDENADEWDDLMDGME